MNWFGLIEKRKTLIVGCILFIAFSALTATSLRSSAAYDTFWHLQMGKDWLENGLSPWIDHYSFTFNGHKISGPPVFFQGLLHHAVSHFGMRDGFQLIRFGFFFLAIAMALLLLRRIKAPAIIYALVVPMIVFLLQLRPIVRPELLSYSFSIIALMLYFRAGNKISVRNLVPMIVLLLVWSNYHSSIIGYVIFFGFFLDCAVAQMESREPASVWLRWLAWGLLMVAVSFLNPGFNSSVIGIFSFSSEWKIRIEEYLPPGSVYQSLVGIYVLILIAALTPVMALQQRKFGYLVVWAILTYSAVSMRRMVTPSGIIVVLLAAQLFINSGNLDRLTITGSKYRDKLVVFALMILIGITVFSNVERARSFVRENRTFIGRYPAAIADYMIERKMSGNIFNDYGMGGYLIYRLAPQNQVYIDGRTGILYPLEHLKRHEEIARTSSPDVLRAELDKYAIDYILRKHTQTTHDLLQDMGGFGLDFLSFRFVLYTRGASNFSLSGKLLSYPECWRTDMLDELTAERQIMDDILPEYSGLFPFTDLIIGYSNADDGKAFFDTFIDEMEWFDEMRRFAGFRFLEMGEYDFATILLGGVEARKPKDYLASALAMIKAGDYELASQIIEEYASIDWPRLKTEDIFIQYQLYQLLQKQRELTFNEQKNVGELKAQLIELEHIDFDSNRILDIESFCADSMRD